MISCNLSLKTFKAFSKALFMSVDNLDVTVLIITEDNDFTLNSVGGTTCEVETWVQLSFSLCRNVHWFFLPTCFLTFFWWICFYGLSKVSVLFKSEKYFGLLTDDGKIYSNLSRGYYAYVYEAIEWRNSNSDIVFLISSAYLLKRLQIDSIVW